MTAKSYNCDGVPMSSRSHGDSKQKRSRPSRLGVSLIFAVAMWGLAHAVDLKPKRFPLKILGVAVDIPVTISFDVQSNADALMMQVRALGDFRSVQDKALEIVRKMPVPRDNCARDGINVVVDSIDSTSITPSGKTAVVDLGGGVTVWGCAGLFGQKVKTIAFSDSVNISFPVEVVIVDQRQVGLRLAAPVSLKTGHRLTAEAARLLLGDLNAWLTAELSKILDAHDARAGIPPLSGLDATIERAEFAQNGTTLMLSAAGSGRMNGVAFNTLLELFTK